MRASALLLLLALTGERHRPGAMHAAARAQGRRPLQRLFPAVAAARAAVGRLPPLTHPPASPIRPPACADGERDKGRDKLSVTEAQGAQVAAPIAPAGFYRAPPAAEVCADDGGADGVILAGTLGVEVCTARYRKVRTGCTDLYVKAVELDGRLKACQEQAQVGRPGGRGGWGWLLRVEAPSAAERWPACARWQQLAGAACPPASPQPCSRGPTFRHVGTSLPADRRRQHGRPAEAGG